MQPPRPPPAWQSLYAADYGPICPQPVKSVVTANKRAVVMNEDCLYLNIFTPSVSEKFISMNWEYPLTQTSWHLTF